MGAKAGTVSHGTRGEASATVQLRPASNSTTELIQQTWAEVLHLDAVASDDDFFEIGGNSLFVVTALARLREQLGIALPMLALFEAPTPAELAELISELHDEQDRPTAGAAQSIPDWVVPLQREGDGRPVFVFPAGHNETWALAKDAQIAAHVGHRHPFWGFQRDHPGLDRAREEGLPTLAAEYVRQIRSIQDEGSYLLSGNCAGGYMAWETARQLLASGQEIAGLLLYEVPLRADFAQLLPGVTPAHVSRPLDLSQYYRPAALPIDVTFLMTEPWHGMGWWQPWQEVTGGVFTSVVIPVDAQDTSGFRAQREAIIAGHMRAWIETAEARAHNG